MGLVFRRRAKQCIRPQWAETLASGSKSSKGFLPAEPLTLQCRSFPGPPPKYG